MNMKLVNVIGTTNTSVAIHAGTHEISLATTFHSYGEGGKQKDHALHMLVKILKIMDGP